VNDNEILDSREILLEISGKVLNVVLEKDGEDEMN
jgi:hypothetical protein